jgi:hypothetical protein
MLINECKQLTKIIEDKAYSNCNLLNIGSSTAEVINKVQPYLGELLTFLKSVNINVINIDIKEEEGVDHCLDFNDNNDLAKISALKPDLILASNVIEHVVDFEFSLNQLCLLAKENNSILILTGPMKYPYHPDPIDNMFRPKSKEELFKLIEKKNLPKKAEFWKTNFRLLISSTLAFPQSLIYPCKHVLSTFLKSIKAPREMTGNWAALKEQFKPVQIFICILEF